MYRNQLYYVYRLSSPPVTLEKKTFIRHCLPLDLPVKKKKKILMDKHFAGLLYLFIFYFFAVLEDVQILTKNHFRDLQQLIKQQQLPILKAKSVAWQHGNQGQRSILQQPSGSSSLDYVPHQNQGGRVNTYGHKYQTGMF